MRDNASMRLQHRGAEVNTSTGDLTAALDSYAITPSYKPHQQIPFVKLAALLQASAAKLARVCLQNSSLEAKWKFTQSWKQTYLRASIPGFRPCPSRPLKVEGFYSDLLYQPWHCSNIPLNPEWLKRDSIDRRVGLSVKEFQEQYETPTKPVILQSAVSSAVAVPPQHLVCRWSRPTKSGMRSSHWGYGLG